LDTIETYFTTYGTGKTPSIFYGKGTRFDFLFMRNGVIEDIGNLSSGGEVTVAILAETFSGGTYTTRTVSVFTPVTGIADWEAGTAQHFYVEFPDNELELPIPVGALRATFGISITGHTSDEVGDEDGFGRAKLNVHRIGFPTEETPIQPGNLVGVGAEYSDPAGTYTVISEAGKYYKWIDGGANDTSITNGVSSPASDTNFIAEGATLVLNGTPGALVTATLIKSPFLTADEVAAMIAGSSTTQRVFFIDPPGNPNGSVTATRPAVAYDANGAFWIKTGSGTSNTGWEQRL
jgi:hypothetical protein